ncbi:uncharacterized protein PHACADRAFT_266570, partial [Phanerochaete carnosa HHB-10118-sp]
MEVAETNVATAVEIPATMRTGKGREEPEPRPNEGRMLSILRRTESDLSVVKIQIQGTVIATY